MSASLVLDDDDGWRSPVLPAGPGTQPLVLGRGTCNIDMKEVYVSRQQFEMQAVDSSTARVKCLGANHLTIDDGSGGGQRQVGKGESASLRVGQHLFLTLSGNKSKRYTLNNTVAPIMAPNSAAATQHKRAHPPDSATSGAERAANAADGEDPYGWSLDNYPADKRARIRMTGNGGGSGSGSAGKQSDGFFTPPVPVTDRQYKQTTLSFSPLTSSAPAASSTTTGSLSFDASSPGFYHIAFPCLGLNVGSSEAMAVIKLCFTAIVSFLLTHTAPVLRLLLCESDDAAYLATKNQLDSTDDDNSVQLKTDSRFHLLHTSVTALGQGSHVSQSVVNSTDWKWSSAGEKKRRAVGAACNGQLTALTVAMLPLGKTAGREGAVQCVPLTRSCPLTDAGVRQVVQVVTPEVTTAASKVIESADGGGLEQLDEKQDGAVDKLSDERANKLLNTYKNMFDAWYTQLKLPKHHIRFTPTRSPGKSYSPSPAASQLRPSQSDALLPDNLATSSTSLPPYSSTRVATAPPTVAGGWNNALRAYLQHPRLMSVQSSVYCEDRSYLVLYDAYPKSRCHLLILAKSHLPQLSGVGEVGRENVWVVSGMRERAEWMVAALMQQMQGNSSRRLEFWIGFHALPSLQPLHCHVLTSDLSTVHMKHKKHYNSFATPFFVKIEDVMQRVEKDGKYTVDEDRMKLYEKAALKCWRCHATIQTMPALKQHLLTCNA